MHFAADAIPRTLREVDEGWSRARPSGDRMITDRPDEGTVRVAWLGPTGEPYLEAFYCEATGELVQAPLL